MQWAGTVRFGSAALPPVGFAALEPPIPAVQPAPSHVPVRPTCLVPYPAAVAWPRLLCPTPHRHQDEFGRILFADDDHKNIMGVKRVCRFSAHQLLQVNPETGLTTADFHAIMSTFLRDFH